MSADRDDRFAAGNQSWQQKMADLAAAAKHQNGQDEGLLLIAKFMPLSTVALQTRCQVKRARLVRRQCARAIQ